jgi:dipeptidyl aminopeptidase/acylaminoacyl peptidase
MRKARFLVSLSCERLVGAVALLAIAALLVPGAARAQMADDAAYQVPAAELTALVDAPVTPLVSVSPNRSTIVLIEVPPLSTIADVSQPELRIAGLRINPRTNGPSRDRYYTNLTIRRLADGSEAEVTGLPGSPHLGNVSWAPDGASIAFTHQTESGIELWVADVASASARRLVGARVNDAFGRPFYWKNDSATIVARLVPEGRGPAPTPSTVPVGPIIQQSVGRAAQARTYQDLLKNADDEALFAHYMAARVALVALDGSIAEIGPEGLISRAEPSPDGEFLLVETIHRPFSYVVPVYRFPTRIEVWANDGTGVKSLADLPLRDELPPGFDSVATGPRSINWRDGADATLYWAEAQDGGDARTDSAVRDRVLMLAAPFEDEPQTVADLGLRFAGAMWGEGDLALVTAFWRGNRTLQTWQVRPDSPGAEPVLMHERSREDRYSDPGTPRTTTTARGDVLVTSDDGASLMMFGQGASPEGNRPFVDRYDLASGETTRLWQSEAPYYEMPVALLEADGSRVLTRRESVTEPPNYFVRDLTGGALEQLTWFEHPTPQLADIKKELVHYERADGVQLTGTLYLPPGYEEGDGPLPMLMWAYPIEFKNAAFAGQVQDSPYEFTRVSYWGALPMLTQGWAVFDDPKLPIIGEGDQQPNDNFRQELVSGAEAAVKVMVDRGIADPDRIAIGGHSYGAFMTANLLAHSDLFRAGIARSGAYNRTLTPFGFQSEERTYWEAPEVYFTMSPFMHAEKVNEPILMIHGAADNNSGTFPIQSERYYAALQGHGAIARLVMLPHESHGYRARESLLHMLWEESEFLKRYVQHAPPRGEATNDDASGEGQN